MTMTADFEPFPGRGSVRTGRRQAPARRHDPHDFRDILHKHDDRLIHDVGLTRDEILGPELAFWSAWLRVKQPWRL